jgi:F0F1-type ATP synthase membrane subunit b/b'
MNLKKFIIPAVTLVVGAAAGVVYGVRNSDRIKTSLDGFKEATEEKLKQIQEAAAKAEAEAKEAVEDGKKEAEEVAGKVAEAAAEIVDIGEKQPQQPREQPRGKDGKFVKA